MVAPWASGPGEILQHGLSLLTKDSDVNRRLAMLSIDNSVELMIKTYLGLPKRATKLSISRREYFEICESFTKLLDALEQYAADKVAGIDLAEIEWYHRLRNELYHQGNGLTVERNKVEVYAGLARLLFRNLFGHDLQVVEDDSYATLGEFMSAWMRLEKTILEATQRARRDEELEGSGRAEPSLSSGAIPDDVEFDMMPRVAEKRESYSSKRHNAMYRNSRLLRELAHMDLVDMDTVGTLIQLRDLRNRIMHGDVDYRKALRPEVTETIDKIGTELRRKLTEFK